MRTILFTNVRDEPHILEWVQHHLKRGFTTVYIFDHRSQVPVSTVVRGWPNVIIERINIEFANKTRLMLSASNYALRNGYDWLMYLDGDEFLFLRHAQSVSEFIDKFENVDQIGLNWVVFGSNYLEKTPKEMVKSYTRSLAKLHQEVKVFVRPRMVDNKRLPSPHYFYMKPGARSVGWDGGDLTGPRYTDKSGMDKNLATAYIAHYILQSYETYLLRKGSRDRDDIPGVKWPHVPRNSFHARYNDIINMDLLGVESVESVESKESEECVENSLEPVLEPVDEPVFKPIHKREPAFTPVRLPALPRPIPQQGLAGAPFAPVSEAFLCFLAEKKAKEKADPPPPQPVLPPQALQKFRVNYYKVQNLRNRGSF